MIVCETPHNDFKIAFTTQVGLHVMSNNCVCGNECAASSFIQISKSENVKALKNYSRTERSEETIWVKNHQLEIHILVLFSKQSMWIIVTCWTPLVDRQLYASLRKIEMWFTTLSLLWNCIFPKNKSHQQFGWWNEGVIFKLNSFIYCNCIAWLWQALLVLCVLFSFFFLFHLLSIVGIIIANWRAKFFVCKEFNGDPLSEYVCTVCTDEKQIIAQFFFLSTFIHNHIFVRTQSQPPNR